MIIYILIALLGISAFLAIKWRIERNILMDQCADCFKRLDESAQNTYKSEYVHKLKQTISDQDESIINLSSFIQNLNK